MGYMGKLMRRFRHDQKGAALVEYGMLVSLTGIGAVAAVTRVGTHISSVYSHLSSQLAAITGTG